MGRPKGVKNKIKDDEEIKPIQETTQSPIQNSTIIPTTDIHKKEELIKILRHNMNACYDSEPRGSLTSHLNVMVEKIINLFEN